VLLHSLDVSFACVNAHPSPVRFFFASDSPPLTQHPAPSWAARDARALQARLFRSSGIHDAARSGNMGLVQDHIFADGACINEKDM
jgi:hypothetical protein